MNSVFTQYEELSSPQFADIDLSLRLRMITANFGLDNSSFRAQPHSLIVNKIYTYAILNLINFELWPKFPDVLSKNYQKSQIKLSLVNEIAYRRWVSNLAGEYQIIPAGCRPINTVFEAYLWDNSPYVEFSKMLRSIYYIWTSKL